GVISMNMHKMKVEEVKDRASTITVMKRIAKASHNRSFVLGQSSSRGHIIFVIQLSQTFILNNTSVSQMKSELTIVDMAGHQIDGVKEDKHSIGKENIEQYKKKMLCSLETSCIIANLVIFRDFIKSIINQTIFKNILKNEWQKHLISSISKASSASIVFSLLPSSDESKTTDEILAFSRTIKDVFIIPKQIKIETVVLNERISKTTDNDGIFDKNAVGQEKIAAKKPSAQIEKEKVQI
ncbi:hypothetical protein RFI_38886, partial [Reticulomyxa filosa]